MGGGIRIRKVWLDGDMVELQIDVSDGVSSFSNRAYVGHGHLAETVAQLDGFSGRLHGGLFDLRFGEFGPEYASGAFHARLRFPIPGRLYITSRQESEYGSFAKKTVASCATLYLMYAAWEHNPQGAYYELGWDGLRVIHCGYWGLIGASWFLIVFVPLSLLGAGVLALSSRLDKRRSAG